MTMTQQLMLAEYKRALKHGGPAMDERRVSEWLKLRRDVYAQNLRWL